MPVRSTPHLLLLLWALPGCGGGALGDDSGSASDDTSGSSWTDTALEADWAYVGAGGVHNCAITEAGSIRCWGADKWGQTSDEPDEEGYAEVTAGTGFEERDYESHSCALRTASVGVGPRGSAGDLACWGDDEFDQVLNTPWGREYTAVSAGGDFTCALHTSGDMICWGSKYGTLAGEDLVTLSAGQDHICALKRSGEILCDGRDTYQQLSETPDGDGFTALSAGTRHTCALDGEGAITCWGFPEFQLEHPPPGGSGFTALASGFLHSCAINSASEIECWGIDDYGLITRVPTGEFAQVSAGLWHTCGIRRNGVLECWGITTGEYSRGQVTQTP
jgi:alpha-tubulin suppressor-like RCC1 family protein